MGAMKRLAMETEEAEIINAEAGNAGIGFSEEVEETPEDIADYLDYLNANPCNGCSGPCTEGCPAEEINTLAYPHGEIQKPREK